MPSAMVRRTNLVDFANSMQSIIESYEEEMNFLNDLQAKFPEYPTHPGMNIFKERQEGVKFALKSFCERFDIEVSSKGNSPGEIMSTTP